MTPRVLLSRLIALESTLDEALEFGSGGAKAIGRKLVQAANHEPAAVAAIRARLRSRWADGDVRMIGGGKYGVEGLVERVPLHEAGRQAQKGWLKRKAPSLEV